MASLLEDARWLDDPADYGGEPSILVRRVTFRPRLASERALARRWDDFFARTQPIESLGVADSWLTQEQLVLVSRQTSLRELAFDALKLTDLEPLAALQSLERLSVARLRTPRIDMLSRLPQLRHLHLDEATLDLEYRSLAALLGLQTLELSPRGMPDRWLDVEDLDWLLPLQRLERLVLIGVRVRNRDVSPLARLPALRSLILPPRRDYRQQVLDLAPHSAPLAEIAERYREIDRAEQRWRDGAST
jgi:hypothetical protein